MICCRAAPERGYQRKLTSNANACESFIAKPIVTVFLRLSRLHGGGLSLQYNTFRGIPKKMLLVGEYSTVSVEQYRASRCDMCIICVECKGSHREVDLTLLYAASPSLTVRISRDGVN